jgi:hypothetical protein
MAREELPEKMAEHQFVSDDCNRLTPTNAVSQSQQRKLIRSKAASPRRIGFRSFWLD